MKSNETKQTIDQHQTKNKFLFAFFCKKFSLCFKCLVYPLWCLCWIIPIWLWYKYVCLFLVAMLNSSVAMLRLCSGRWFKNVSDCSFSLLSNVPSMWSESKKFYPASRVAVGNSFHGMTSTGARYIETDRFHVVPFLICFKFKSFPPRRMLYVGILVSHGMNDKKTSNL